jgi:hypothetical protein
VTPVDPKRSIWEHKILVVNFMAGHNSAFDAIYNGVKNASILFNGKGNITRFSGHPAPDPIRFPIPKPFTLVFEPQAPKPRLEKRPPPKKYLLRLINTSWDSTFIFSIDNHILTIAGADFVPIVPYHNTSVLIGIGQRYQLVVEAAPKASGDDKPPADGNFWMRTWIAPDCFHGSEQGIHGYEKAGILRYDNTSTSFPTSKPWANISHACSDETYSSLHPILEWQVGKASNGRDGENRAVKANFTGPPTAPFPVAKFSFSKPGDPAFIPLRIDYSDPIFLSLNYTGTWPESWVVLPENYSSTDWVCYLSPVNYYVLFSSTENMYDFTNN